MRNIIVKSRLFDTVLFLPSFIGLCRCILHDGIVVHVLRSRSLPHRRARGLVVEFRTQLVE
jgi:hypothetical protein